MDWTNVFQEDGDEAFFISEQLSAIPQAPRLARLVSKLYHDHRHDNTRGQHRDHQYPESDEDIIEHRLFQLSSRSASDRSIHSTEPSSSAYTLGALYYLSINYILGVGCLGIPYAFAKAGFLLCTSILLIVTLSSYMTVMWVAETGERYHALSKHHQYLQQQSNNAEPRPSGNVVRAPSETSSLMPLPSQEQHHHRHWDRYEVVDLVGFYLGPAHKILYQISLMALMYIGLLAYSQVFCSAISELLLWGKSASVAKSMAGLPQIVFGAMVIPLSCFELDEQISVQSLMAAVRFLAIFIMVFGSILALLFDGSRVDASHHHGPPYFAPAEREGCQMSYTFCVSGFGVAFSTSLFSQLFQHSVPGLLRPLRDQPSKHHKIPVRIAVVHATQK
jgi:hypothetical protein